MILSLNENTAISEEGFAKLRYLSIKGCEKIDYEGLETLIQFHKVNPSFKIMNIYEDYKDSLCIDKKNEELKMFIKYKGSW